jgi:hypothetical protein
MKAGGGGGGGGGEEEEEEEDDEGEADEEAGEEEKIRKFLPMTGIPSRLMKRFNEYSTFMSGEN